MSTLHKFKRVFQVYPDTKGRWRWRVIARIDRITGNSAEDFDNKANAKRAALREASFYVRGTVCVIVYDTNDLLRFASWPHAFTKGIVPMPNLQVRGSGPRPKTPRQPRVGLRPSPRSAATR